MFVVNYPLFSSCLQEEDGSQINPSKHVRNKSQPHGLCSQLISPDTREIISTTCYFLLVPDYLAEIFELRRVLTSIK